MRKLLNINRLNENRNRRRVSRRDELEMGIKRGNWGQKWLKKKEIKKVEKLLTFCRRGVISHCYNILNKNRYETN